MVFIVSMAACNPRLPDEDVPPDDNIITIDSSLVREPTEYKPDPMPDFLDAIAEKYALNKHTVGWLHIPGTTVDDVVLAVQDPADRNSYYLRRDFNGNHSQEGVYFADCRNKFDGTVERLSFNTTIYGHALDMKDNPDAKLFSQLKKYWDIEFAKNHPYIFFSIAGEDLVWEIFAVYYATVDHDYINPLDTATAPVRQKFINELKKSSIYIYEDIEVTPTDKLLTLSTCVYKFTPGVYPNKYRFVITARLVNDMHFTQFANVVENPSPLKVDDSANRTASFS